MKKVIFIALIAFFLNTNVCIPAYQRVVKTPYVFGIPMSKERGEIEKLFSIYHIPKLLSKGPVDVYSQSLVKVTYLKQVWLYYINGKLAKVALKFDVPIDPKTETSALLVGFYKKLLKYLSDQYGEPTNSTRYVHPNFFYKLVAFETGNAYYFDYWENADDMKILLYIKGKNQSIDFSLIYEYMPLSNRQTPTP